ncbi:MAG: type II secretion system F family protein, partial [Candidatus Nealsonbacteria bacterium]|nr:type II secretion system F family protein [Candidatus Nealsonbacteria bacterium]
MKFNYQARTKTGEAQSGVLDASSREAALDLLQRYQLFVTALEEAEAKPFYTKKIKLFGRVSAKELVAFSRQLSLMFKAKIPLTQSLKTLAEQAKNQEFKEKILMISDEIEGGAPFSQALSRFPKLFSPFFINMVKSGEASGTLSGSLDFLADHLEREYHLFSKLKGALVYPALILIVSLGVLLMMMFFVIPNLARVLTETGQALPLPTRIVIGLSDFLRQRGWILLILIAIASFFASRYFGTAAGRKLRDKITLRIPLIKTFLKMILVSRFAENLSTLIAGGLPITQSLEITADVVGNSVY